MLLTLTRRQETALARWRDVNMEARTWTIPETKNGEPHVVPLSRQAMDLLRSRLPTDDGGNPEQPEPNALIFATSTGAPLGNWDRETKALQEASGTDGLDPPRSAPDRRDDARRNGRAAGHHRSGAEPRLASARRWPRHTTALATVRRWPQRYNGWRMRWTGSRRVQAA